MSKSKNFNFAQMAESPVVKDANETMTKAFEQKAESQQDKQQGGAEPTEKKEEQPEPQPEQTEVQQFPSVSNATMLTAQRRNEQTMTMDDHLRDEWMQYLGAFAGSLTVGANVQLPEDIDDRLDAISKRMRGVGTVKMPKKNLILLAIWEFVEKYDR